MAERDDLWRLLDEAAAMLRGAAACLDPDEHERTVEVVSDLLARIEALRGPHASAVRPVPVRNTVPGVH
jgi:hypothetical protein